jgi:hypothetical protein
MNPHLDQVGTLVKSVDGNKQLLAQMVQRGHVPHDIALLAGMRIDRLSKPQGNPGPQPTVLEKEFAPQQQMAPQGLAQLQQPQMPQQPPQMPPQMQQPVQAAEGGLMQLPVGDMFNENSYAGGGIIAFDEGGDVPRFDGLSGSLVGIDPAIATLARTMGISYEKAAQLKKQTEQPANASMGDPYKNAMLRSMGLASEKEATVNPQTNNLVDSQDIKNMLSLSAKPKREIPTLASSTIDQDRKDTPKSYKPEAGLGAYKDLAYKPYSIDEAMYDKSLMPKRTAQEGVLAFKNMMGEDEGLKGLKGKFTDMEERSKAEELQAPWMALARAGFGMMGGKSQYALSNIAEGATAGLSDYAASKDKLRAAEEKRFGLQAQIAQAERAEQRDAVKYGVDSEQHIDSQNRLTQLHKADAIARAQEVNKKQEYDAIKDKYDFLQKDKALNLQAEANKIARASGLAEKQRAMYEKALDNARADVTASIKATGAEGNMTEEAYNNAVYAKYLTNLSSMGLAPLSQAPGFKFLGEEKPKGK